MEEGEKEKGKGGCKTPGFNQQQAVGNEITVPLLSD